jgi:Zn-dependent protease with chaperone function
MQLFRVLALSLTGALLALCACAIFFVSLFEAPKLFASWMPAAVADKIGLQGVALFDATSPECNEGKGAAALARILDRLQSGGRYGRPFKLHLVIGEQENAFALPGRHIILVSGLLKPAKAPEDIAGVLAHEMGHGLEKDAEALFLRNIGMKVIFEFTSWGDDSRAAFRAMLSQLRYSREAEVTADAHAIAILRHAHVSSRYAGEFILRSAAESPTGESTMDDFGAHLSAEERAKLFLAQPPYEAEPILSEEEWAAAKAVCGDGFAPGGDRMGAN